MKRIGVLCALMLLATACKATHGADRLGENNSPVAKVCCTRRDGDDGAGRRQAVLLQRAKSML